MGRQFLKGAVTIIIIIFASLNTYAWKVKSDSTIYAGAWGGTSYANIMGYTNPTTPIYGNAFGLRFWFQPTREFSLSTGLGFIQKGFSTDVEYYDTYSNSVGFYGTNFDFNYLNIPLGLNYNLGRNRFNIYLSAGIDIDILLKEITYSALVPPSQNGVDIVNDYIENTDIYKTLNFGVYLGGGFEYRFKPNIIAFADVKYMHGMNNIIDVNSIYIIKQRPVVFGIGVRFGIPITYGYYD
jgi:hypothetical protein